MVKKSILVILAFLVVSLNFGCGGGGMPVPKQGEYLNLTVSKAKELIASDKGLLLVDVRTPGEFQGGHIAGAVNIPGENLEAAMANWDKNSTILLVCLSGARSELASRFLAQNGFNKVYNMAGGMQAWDGEVVQ